MSVIVCDVFTIVLKTCNSISHVHCPYSHPSRTWPLHDDYLNKFMWCECACAFLLAWMFVYFCLIFFLSSLAFPLIGLWISWCRFSYDDAYLFWGFGTVMRTKVLITSTLGMYCIWTCCVWVGGTKFRFQIQCWRQKSFCLFWNYVRVRKLKRKEYDGFHLTCALSTRLSQTVRPRNAKIWVYIRWVCPISWAKCDGIIIMLYKWFSA